MKYHLFVDNFRGFTSTCIPILDVNFFVGENSTGKSSILGLINLLSATEFALGRDFERSDAQVGFRHFSDMVSAHSSDQTYFRVGFVFEMSGKKAGNSAVGCLFTFHEKQGLPRLHKATFCRNGETVTVRFGNSIYFKMRREDRVMTSQELLSVLTNEWVGEHSTAGSGYEKLTGLPKFRSIPIFVILSLISDMVNRQKGGKESENLFFPPFGFGPPQLTWFGPIRTEPKRTYDELAVEFSPEGRHTPYLIRRMLQSKTHADKLKSFIEDVGKASGLFQDVKIQKLGRGANPRFELDIVLDDAALNILNVGYGVSQSLPIIVELLVRDKGTWFAIQEPEIHLHPRAQAALGDVFFKMASLDGKSFLIETHSDFTIDRFRMNYKNGEAAKPESQVLFFERHDKHNIVTPLRIGQTGDLPDDQPESYRRFFIREQMKVLGI